MNVFLAAANADAAATGGLGSPLIMMVAIVAIFYFLMIRPENKRKKEAQAMRDAIKVGDNITTIGGVMGDVVSIKDNSIVIETSADRVRVEFAKFAISTNNTAEKEAAKKKAAAAAARKEELAKKKAEKENKK
ncbi:MAG: preprotein translocase subunit YajC [Oscillospiraceae bacterium]|nr:preprotein translocase subunit YajC [Oscillospiraceae bacterium]